MVFEQKYFSTCTLLTDQIYLSSCLCFVRYLAICVLYLFVNQVLTSYSGLFRHIQNPVQPSHIHSIAMFRALAHLKPEASSKLRHQTYSEPCRNQTVYSAIIQPYSGIFRILCSPHIWRNLAYLESWNIQNPSVIVSRLPFLLQL